MRQPGSLAKKSKDGPQARRLLALKLGGEPLVYEMVHLYLRRPIASRHASKWLDGNKTLNLLAGGSCGSYWEPSTQYLMTATLSMAASGKQLVKPSDRGPALKANPPAGCPIRLGDHLHTKYEEQDAIEPAALRLMIA
jgi:hypothetical protein